METAASFIVILLKIENITGFLEEPVMSENRIAD